MRTTKFARKVGRKIVRVRCLPPMPEALGRLPRTGQHHRIHVGVGDQPAAGIPVDTRQELEHGPGDSTRPQGLGQLARYLEEDGHGVDGLAAYLCHGQRVKDPGRHYRTLK